MAIGAQLPQSLEGAGFSPARIKWAAALGVRSVNVGRRPLLKGFCGPSPLGPRPGLRPATAMKSDTERLANDRSRKSVSGLASDMPALHQQSAAVGR
jgi:hypothetical protein